MQHSHQPRSLKNPLVIRWSRPLAAPPAATVIGCSSITHQYSTFALLRTICDRSCSPKRRLGAIVVWIVDGARVRGSMTVPPLSGVAARGPPQRRGSARRWRLKSGRSVLRFHISTTTCFGENHGTCGFTAGHPPCSSGRKGCSHAAVSWARVMPPTLPPGVPLSGPAAAL